MEAVTDYGFISAIPILVLIAGILITKKLAEMLFLSTLVGAIIVFKAGFFGGYIELFYETLSNGAFQFLFLILITFGPLMVLFEKSGSLLGFSSILSKFATTPRRALVVTWIFGIIIFIDDYLNALAVSTAMRNITDQMKVPREHLAYTVNSTGTCVCVLIPFTSWSAFTIAVCSPYGLTFSDYVKAIPFMFYPWAAIILSLLLAAGLIPKIGPIKKAYQRVADGGPVTVPLEETGDSFTLVNLESSTDIEPAKPINFILPIIVLIVVMLYYDGDLVHGCIAAIICQLFMYLGQKIMTGGEFVKAVMEGVNSMATLIFIIFIGFSLNGINGRLGFSEFMIDLFTKNITPSLLPAITFLLFATITFVAAGFWPMIVIGVPIFVPLALEVGMNPSILIAAIVSGVALGSQSCFYCDAVFMTAAGTGVPNVPQVRAILPYVGIGVSIATILFVIVGFMA